MRTKRILRQALVVSTVVGALATIRSSPAQACSTQIIANYGWTLPNPVTTQVFWPNARSDASTLANDWVLQLNDANFYSPVQDYGINPGTMGSIYVPWNLPHGGTLPDAWIQDGLVSTLAEYGMLPRAEEVYLIFLPSDTTAEMDSQPGAHGYHGAASRQLWDGNTYLLVYAVVEDTDFQTTNVSVSHELYEAFTDPIPVPTGNGNHIQCTGYCDTADNELADLCESQFGGIWQGDYGMTLAQVWSQTYCTCLPPAF